MTAPATSNRLYIFGAGGFAREVAWLAATAMDGVDTCLVVDKPEYLTGTVNGFPVELLSELPRGSGASFVVALGDPTHRERAVRACSAHGLQAVSIVHPGVERSRWVEVQEGAILCAGNIITTNIRIGRHVHLNLSCTIGHDVVIDDYATLAPGVHVSGNVHVGRGAYIGTGASIINGPPGGPPLVIGDGAMVAAGACVTGHVAPWTLVAGVPAVTKKQLSSSAEEG